MEYGGYGRGRSTLWWIRSTLWWTTEEDVLCNGGLLKTMSGSAEMFLDHCVM